MECKCGTTHPMGVCHYKQDPKVRKDKLAYKAQYRSTRRSELSNKEKERMKDPNSHQRKLEWDREYKKRPEYKEQYTTK